MVKIYYSNQDLLAKKFTFFLFLKENIKHIRNIYISTEFAYNIDIISYHNLDILS